MNVSCVANRKTAAVHLVMWCFDEPQALNIKKKKLERAIKIDE